MKELLLGIVIYWLMFLISVSLKGGVKRAVERAMHMLKFILDWYVTAGLSGQKFCTSRFLGTTLICLSRTCKFFVCRSSVPISATFYLVLVIVPVGLYLLRIFFSTWVFLHEHPRITGLQEKWEGVSLTPHYHFHPLHRQSEISRAITAES